MKKITFALYFGNRGFFPGELIASAREEVRAAVQKLGFDTIEMEESLTRFGAVETFEEGKLYANFLEENRGKFDGVILSLPNFGDENGAVVALRDCNVPILLQAYPDEIGLMDFSHRRDAFCGKVSIADVFRQCNIPFTSFEPHVCHPSSDVFKGQLLTFAQVCAVVRRMRRFNVGAIGARTTVFKTIRFDELALQKYGINTETFDLSQLFERMHAIDRRSKSFVDARNAIEKSSDCSAMPAERLDDAAALFTALKEIVREFSLDAIALRCWNEIQTEFKIAPCTIMGLLNAEGIAASCELDVCNAVAMSALNAAADLPAICMDWNNNYGDDPDKCILFHCGSVAPELMTTKGKTCSHPMFDKTYGAGSGWGCNEGRVKAGPLTYASCKTENGKLVFYIGEGSVTEDEIENGYFGCAGVVQIPALQKLLLNICKQGFRHHVSITISSVGKALQEAFETYLGYEIANI